MTSNRKTAFDTPEPVSFRKKLQWIGLILGLALSLRIWYFIELRQSPYFGYPIIDSLHVQRQAESMHEGIYPYDRAFFKAPLYPHLIGLFYYLFGVRYSPLHLLHLVLGAVNCVLLYLLASRFLPQWAAVSAGVVAALYRPFIFFEGELLTPVLLTFFNLFFVLWLDLAWKNRNKRHVFFSGVIAGFSAITRSTGLLFALLVVLFSVIYRFTTRKKRSQRQYTSRLAARFILGMIIIVAPVTIANYYLEGDLVLVSSNGGINFYTGNNKNTDGTTPVLPGVQWERLVRQQREWGLIQSSDISRAWGEKGLYFIQEHPGKAAHLWIRKLLLFLKNQELRNNKGMEFVKRFSAVLRLPLPGFGLIMPLAVLGLAITFRHWRKFWPLYLVPTTVLLVNIIFFTCARYRVTAAPFLICFALQGVLHLSTLIRAGSRRAIGRACLPVILLLVFAFQPWWPALKSYTYRDYFNLGNVYWQRGDHGQARECYQTAITMEPDDPDIYVGLALAFEQENDILNARGTYIQGLSLARDHPDMLINLGSLLVRIGLYAEAGDYLLQALNLQPDNPLIHFNMATCMESMGKYSGAVQSYKKALELGGPVPDILNNLGYLYIKMGINHKEAVHMLEEAVKLKPGDGLIRDSLGWGYFKMGKLDESRNELEKARKLEPENLTVRLHLATVYAALKDTNLALEELKMIRDGFSGTREAAEAKALIDTIESGEKAGEQPPQAVPGR